jgi:hypothetical protein
VERLHLRLCTRSGNGNLRTMDTGEKPIMLEAEKPEVATMQSPLVGLMDGGGEGSDVRTRKAWAAVAEGYRQALTEISASDPEFARMVRGHRRTRRLAGLPVLRLAQERPHHSAR